MIFKNDLIRKLIRTAKKYGTSYFIVKDTESIVIKSDNADNILNAIVGGDEEIGFNCFDSDKKYLGWFGLNIYNEVDEMIYDYTDNDFCNNVVKLLQY